MASISWSLGSSQSCHSNDGAGHVHPHPRGLFNSQVVAFPLVCVYVERDGGDDGTARLLPFYLVSGVALCQQGGSLFAPPSTDARRVHTDSPRS
jgi:hypothetical protein